MDGRFNINEYQQGDTVSIYSHGLNKYIKMFFISFERIGERKDTLKIIISTGIQYELRSAVNIYSKLCTSRMVLFEKTLKVKEIR